MLEHHDYSISELALVFPDMDEKSFSDLVRSICENGLLDPITVCGD